MATNPLFTLLSAIISTVRFRSRMLAAWATTNPLSPRGLKIALTLPAIAGADDDPDPDPDPSDPDPDPGSDPDPDPDPDPSDPDPDPEQGKEPNWKQMARKHERESKKLRKQHEDAVNRLKAREDADKSEQEKAVEEAYNRAKQELQETHDKERRQDRLEAAAARVAGKGIKLGTGDDAKTVRFADADDALLHLERDIRNGDLDPEDIFDDNGGVKTPALEEALADLLERKPHLAAVAANGEGGKKVTGSADARKGEPAKGDASVEDHLKKIRRHSPGTPAQAVQVGRPAG